MWTERREIENLCNEKAKLEALITEFKNNNEEYLKIKQVAEEQVIYVLTNSKIFCNFAIGSIESLRRNPELCNFLIYDNSNNATISYRSDCLSLMLSGQQLQSFSYLNDNIYAAVILEESEKLYNGLTTELTNWSIAAAATIR